MAEITKGTLEKLKACSTATLTTQLFKRNFRQQFLVGLETAEPEAGRFAGEAFTRPACHRAVDMPLPIGCAGVVVYSGDIVVGDSDGVVVVPRAIAAELAEVSYEQEQREKFLFTKIDAGAPLWGTYPPNEETLKEYAEWRARTRVIYMKDGRVHEMGTSDILRNPSTPELAAAADGLAEIRSAGPNRVPFLVSNRAVPGIEIVRFADESTNVTAFASGQVDIVVQEPAAISRPRKSRRNSSSPNSTSASACPRMTGR